MERKIWTPGGDVVVGPGGGRGPSPTQPAAAPATPPPPSTAEATGHAPPELSEEDIRQLVEQIRQIPVAQFVAEQALGFVQVAQVHLVPDELDDARLAIDALAGILDKTQDRLGQAGEELGRILHQLRLAFVDVTNAAASSSQAEPS